MCYHDILPEKTAPYINNFGVKYKDYNYSNEVIEKVAQLIKDDKIIGICNGYGEAGPRALGNRSILARADSNGIAEKVSRKIKDREWYRPIVPVMLKKHAVNFTGLHNFPEATKYMLFDFKIRNEYVKELAGVVHADWTSRIQILEEKKSNPFLYDLLECCYEKHKMRALINTSFNKRNLLFILQMMLFTHIKRQGLMHWF
ncbi:MAG: hypothetical protein JW894_11180 [Bacteroidales bacterium]|nr:hypothetical protein [Bacteroidales bacterium]